MYILFISLDLDLWIVIARSPKFGEMRIFVLLGLLSCLCDSSEQACFCKEASREIHFCLQVYLTGKYTEMCMF